MGRGRVQRGMGGSLGDAVTAISARTSGCNMLEIWGECLLDTQV